MQTLSGAIETASFASAALIAVIKVKEEPGQRSLHFL